MNKLTIGKLSPLSYSCAEAINTLCTNLSFSGEHTRKIMITSCHASEGKSFISMNVMRTMAKYGKSVVLVDADLRRSMIKTHYQLHFEEGSQRLGLAHLLAGRASEQDVIYQTDIPGAYMVPVGREVSNPMPLLNSPRFGALLNNLAQAFDYVLVDVPPVGTVIDAAESCDGTLLIVNYNSVRRQELIDVCDQMHQTGCPILGAVLNMVEYDSYLSKKYYYKSYGYYNKYGQRYSHDSEQPKNGAKKTK